MESVEAVIGCGVSDHDPDCLCDVVIHNPVPIMNNPVRDMWMGPELCEYRGHGANGWTEQEVLAYLVDIVYLHDMYIAQQKLPKVEPCTPAKGTNVINPWRLIRVQVRQALAESYSSGIRSVLESLRFTAEQFTLAASTGSWHMDMDTLVQFEQAIMDPKRTLGQMSAQFGLSHDSITRFRRYWPNRPTERVMRGSGGHPYQKRMRELVLCGVPSSAIVDVIQAEFNITITKGSVHKLRSRMKDHDTTPH
jgi:hypothetical protein